MELTPDTWALAMTNNVSRELLWDLFDERWLLVRLQQRTDAKKKQDGKRVRAEEQEVKAQLFAAFERHQYYNLKDLVRITQQPVVSGLTSICLVWSQPVRHWEARPPIHDSLWFNPFAPKFKKYILPTLQFSCNERSEWRGKWFPNEEMKHCYVD